MSDAERMGAQSVQLPAILSTGHSKRADQRPTWEGSRPRR